MATPFDEASVDLCRELGVQVLKLASSDGNDWVLIEKLASLRQPVMVSTADRRRWWPSSGTRACRP